MILGLCVSHVVHATSHLEHLSVNILALDRRWVSLPIPSALHIIAQLKRNGLLHLYVQFLTKLGIFRLAKEIMKRRSKRRYRLFQHGKSWESSLHQDVTGYQSGVLGERYIPSPHLLEL